jgi:hypothetical protein
MESEADDSGEPGSSSHADNPPRPSNTPRGDPTPREAADALRGHIDDLIRGARIYVTSQIDLVKAAIRRGVVLLAVAIVALLAAVTIFITAVVLLCLGISDAISQLTGRHWAGELAVGLVVVGGTALAATIGVKLLERQATRRAKRKYEAMNRRKGGNGKQHD